MWKPFKQSLIAIMLLAGAAHAASPADPSKVVRVAFEVADDGFDLAHTSNAYSIWVGEAIFEPLLTYDYVARPAKLVALAAEAMPEVADRGKTYVFRIKKGIYFTPDAAFKGKRHELTAQDYIYTIERLVDPKNRSPSANFVEGKIVGLDDLARAAKKSGHFDYDAPVAGLRAVDRYTLRIALNKPDYNFLYVMAYNGLGAVAREVIEAYGSQSGQHPVGTGPYMLSDYVARSKIILTANPDYRGYIWDFKSSGDAWDDQMVRDMKGKKMPQIGRVEISIIEEEQSRWLAFADKQLDFDKLPQVAAPTVLDGDKLKPEYAAQKIALNRVVMPEIIYTSFNMKDPVIGGYGKEKIALRRAVSMIYSLKDDIAQARNGQAVKAQMIVPVGVVGHDEHYRTSIDEYNIGLANQLLDRFGYRRGADGYRSMPDGKPLLLKISGEPDATSKIYAEIWKRGLDQIGVRADFLTSNFADNMKAATECKLMIWGAAWGADYPEGENFLQLLYGPNSGQGNNSCYQSAAYDALYVKAMGLPPGPERNALYAQMNRQMEADTPWVLNLSRVRNWVVRPWVKGFKKHPILSADWQYLDIEKH
ncbi:MAG TPA: heme-binding protein [Oxalobacteraceae bacterium]|nr:heme-binding protein [Oxalobacteraceae bacterium]